METHQAWKIKFSFKNATIVVCLLNVVTALFLLQGFLSTPSSSSRRNSSERHHHSLAVKFRHLKESEELRRALQPLELISRVRQIEQEAHSEPETVQQKDTMKQTAAFDLSKRLNGFRSTSEYTNMKAVEEWRKRKMERARQRELGRNGTLSSSA